MEKIMKFPAAGQTATKGYPGEMIKYTIDKQFSEKELWKLTVNQYRTKPDGEDGCVNFFAGPPVHDLQGSLNLYRVHYDGIHVVGTAGSIPVDMTDVISLIEKDKINAGAIVSHILGLNAVKETLFAMEKPNGAKKVCYNHLDIPLIAIADLEELGKTNELYRELAKIVKKNNGLWCAEAEEYLLSNAPKI